MRISFARKTKYKFFNIYPCNFNDGSISIHTELADEVINIFELNHLLTFLEGENKNGLQK